ncbi:MAG: PIG-L deacetylase family protein [Candidatus Thorarchaeota archaeon]
MTFKVNGSVNVLQNLINYRSFESDMNADQLRTVLVVCGHPDDETIGAGGTIRKHVDEGIPVDVMSLTADETRKMELEAACAKLGVRKTYTCIRGDFEIDLSLTDEVVQAILECRPRIVITHSSVDYNRNHVMCSRIVDQAVEWAAHTTMFGDKAHHVERIYHMEINSLHSRPNVIVDITSTYELSLAALKEHKTQIAKANNFYLKLYDTRTRLRGVQAECERGEAFTIKLPEHTGPFYPQNSANLLV